MKPIEYWLSAYQESHRHPLNIIIHKLCVPAIVVSIFGLLWGLPLPQFLNFPWWLNGATIISLSLTFFYLRLCKNLAYGMGLLFVALSVLYRWLDVSYSYALLLPLCGIFAGAWILQFIGHAVEGKRPSFMQDLIFLLIGPLWVLAPVYAKLRIPIVQSGTI